MEDEDDGFEPLFSYTKQAPPLLHLLDSDEEDEKAVTLVEKDKSKSLEKKQEQQKVEKPIAAQKHEDDESWLLPPPRKNPVVRAPASLDRTHADIRQKQAELLQLAQRAKLNIERQAALAAAEAAAEIAAEAQAGSVVSTTRPAATGPAAEKILIKVQDKSGSMQSFRISKDDQLDKLFKAYAAAIQASVSQLVFRFDGEQVPGSKTPRNLDLEDEDILEVFLKPATATEVLHKPGTGPDAALAPAPTSAAVPSPAQAPASPVQASRPQKEYVRIKVQDKNGHKLAFRISKDDRLEKLFNAYAASRKLPSQQLVFHFDGDPLLGSQTPRSLDMEDEDTMEVFLKKQ